MSHPHEGHERRMAGKPGRIFSQELKEAAVLRIVVGGE